MEVSLSEDVDNINIQAQEEEYKAVKYKTVSARNQKRRSQTPSRSRFVSATTQLRVVVLARTNGDEPSKWVTDMGKKTKDQEPVANLNNVSNRDIIQRINFLYQASTYLSTVAPSPPDVVAPPIQTKSGSRRRKKNKVRHPMSAAELSRSYVNTMRIVGQKSMVRMDPSIKRTLCKQCDAVLILGSTASVRVKPSRSHGQAVVYTCLSCKSFRVIPAPEVLDPDAPKADDVLLDSNDGAVASTSTGIGEHASAIDIDPTPSALAHTKKKKKKKKKALQSRKRAACVLPHFERKGHVIFRGNEILTRT